MCWSKGVQGNIPFCSKLVICRDRTGSNLVKVPRNSWGDDKGLYCWVFATVSDTSACVPLTKQAITWQKNLGFLDTGGGPDCLVLIMVMGVIAAVANLHREGVRTCLSGLSGK